MKRSTSSTSKKCRETSSIIPRHPNRGTSWIWTAGTVIGRALFEIGDTVRHRRYGYRGIIVERDLSCKASDDWYLGNRTQPEREQPWYHVLVHDVDAALLARGARVAHEVALGTDREL